MLAGRNWTTANAAIVNNRIIQLGGGTITATGASASLTDAAGSSLVGFGTVTATSFANAGTIEASGGTLTLTNAVTGAGALKIDAGAKLVVGGAIASGATASFNGIKATLTLSKPASFAATLGGFGLLDGVILTGVTANAASVNGLNQLVVTNNGTTVATLQLDGAYSGFAFLTESVSGGTEIVALPVPPTVAQYLQAAASYDLISGGFAINDTASNIATNIGALLDSQITAITATSGVVTVSVASFLADTSALDKVVGGFAISDTAQNISASLDQLGDANIQAITVSDNGSVGVSVAQLKSDATAIGKLANQNGTAYSLAVSDTAADIAAGLDGLNGAPIVSITISDNGAIGVSVAQLSSDATAIGKLINQNGTPASLAVTDTAAHIAAALDTLEGLNLASITISDNSAIGVSVAQLSSDAAAIAKLADQNGTPVSFAVTDTAADITAALDQLQSLNLASVLISDNGAVGASVAQLSSDATAIGKLANQNGTPYQLAIADSAANVTATLATLQADVSHIASITASGGPVTVSAAIDLADQAALDKIVGGFAISDSLPTIVSDLSLFNADALVAAILGTSGTATLQGGATIAAPAFSLSGAGTALTVAENLAYAGALTVGTGSSVSVSSGDTLTLKGGATLHGAVSGAGKLAFSGGAATLGSGAALTVAQWSVAGTSLTVSSALSYAGTASFSGGAVVGGSATLTVSGATTVASLTIGGTATIQNKGALTEKSGSVTVGDGLGNVAKLVNATGATYAIADNSGIGRGSSTASLFQNSGLFQKTGGTGTSAISVSFTDTGTVTVASGVLAFSGPTTSIAGALTGAGTISFAGGSTTLKSGASATVANLSEKGSGTALTISENFAYSGAFTQAAGSSLSVSTGDALTLSGTTILAGKVVGAGTLALTGGGASVNTGASLTVANWSISGSGTGLTLNEKLTYSGAFTLGSGAVLTLAGGVLTLKGANSFTNAALAGGQSVSDLGAATVAGLTISGTTSFSDAKSVAQKGGSVTIGDASGGAASLTIASTGTYNITDDSGIALGSASAFLSNAGLFEKTAGTGTSVIAPNVTNAKSIVVSSGVLDFAGAVSGTGAAKISGAATLEFDQAVASGQTVSFSGAGGVLDLTDPSGFAAKIGGFATGDAIDLSGAWQYSSFSENAGGTLGMLTLSSGANQITLDFLGSYSASNFSISTVSGVTTVAHN